jgi:hypothetical protein
MSEKRVFKSVDVAVYGRLDTNNVDLSKYQNRSVEKERNNMTDP